MPAYAPPIPFTELDPTASADLTAHKAVMTAAHGGIVSATDAKHPGPTLSAVRLGA